MSMVVGLTGSSGSHKTVAAKHLEKHFGFDRIHAGDPVKDGVKAGFNLSKDQVRGKRRNRPATELGGQSPRNVMEAYGTGLHTVAPHATSAMLRKNIAKRTAKGKSVVVDGVRSQQEADTIRSMGGTILRMDNGQSPDPNMPLDQKQDGILADARIDSSGKKKDIRRNVDEHMAKLMKAHYSPNTSAATISDTRTAE